MTPKAQAAYDKARAAAHPLDICECGDYRKEHHYDAERDLWGPCKLNGLGHNIPDAELNKCLIFALDRRHTDGIEQLRFDIESWEHEIADAKERLRGLGSEV